MSLFLQLYELSDDVKRKEWLDDWLNFMHRIGKPVTRIPIMAKQVLDLYELYRLVVQHGGLVEIINKKLWREITKGLNLPSSITSAAFTLRTQYQKYLYDYECEKEKLSNQSDLQQAIDGNRREAPGRRTAPSFPLPFPLPHAANAAASMLNKQLNGLGMRNDLLDDENSLNLQASGLFGAGYGVEQMAILEAHQRNLERAQRAAEQVARQSLGLAPCSNGGNRHSGRESTSSNDSDIPSEW
uniref:ARID domain-containing protein n=2 Tax=Caenorhabditis tropicalis TaxID=1561998 RepID=A0A1I7TQZ3_9PELO